MVKVIPAILAKNFLELKMQLEKVVSFTDWVHIDIMDGKFVPNTTWNHPEEVNFENFPVQIEIHLMIQNPDKELHRWLEAGPKRIIFHIEAIEAPEKSETVFDIIRKCSLATIQIGIALNPKTPLSQIEPFLQVIDLVQIMGVDPGFAGQSFQELVLEKIKALRLKNQEILVSVDGGINQNTAPKVVSAGANILVSHSFIFNSPEPKEAFDLLIRSGVK